MSGAGLLRKWPTIRMSVTSREVLPSAKRLIGSLRDIGYDLGASIADLVDNSISAGASRIAIDMRYEGWQSWIRIADNGRGMSRAQLEEALRFGSRRDYDQTDLGRYGLGLKLGTLSQCRLVTVATKRQLTGNVTIAQWDLDHVEATDRWEILRPSASEIDALVVGPLDSPTGTVVMLDDLDRVLRFVNPEGSWAAHAFERATSDVRDHLSMVFHRYLSDENLSGHSVAMFFNGASLVGWDPFCRDEARTLALPEQHLRPEGFPAEASVRVRSFILPNEASFSSPEAHARAAGPNRWNRQQGLYIYRNARLVQSGGWSRLRTSDEHTKLARIAVDFPSVLDDLFSLNIAKSQVRLPSGLRDQLSEIVSAVSQLAQRAYRGASVQPKTTPEILHAVPEKDPRARALSQLVEMVLDTVESALRSELREDSITFKRTVRSLRAMQTAFENELETLVARKPAVPFGEQDVASG
jgi:hypothetical protein